MSALRGDWRFDADVSGMEPGEYTLEVGDLSLPVVLEASVPDRFRSPRLELRPRGLWRTAFADAYGYDTGPASGRLVVDFRERTPPLATDSVTFRTRPARSSVAVTSRTASTGRRLPSNRSRRPTVAGRSAGSATGASSTN
ncbi:hypothetical protein GJ629_04915 [Halapricum sp. CBA1109]|uniref:hypothetical protein n=1 Tax=Halapricum sp. CBA1109 TaxID=2668068 RepID=UPI0012F7E229|nr:hypothetical protein [Halapricum sp. CBA1109]MUV89321.1 hypothetical protein [Halapricum sp. CBA1109]